MRPKYSAAVLLTCAPLFAHGYAPACLPAEPVPLRVRIGPGSAAVDALLQSGAAPALSIVEPVSGRLLWSAGGQPPVDQLFPAMQAAFAGSLVALDLDGDGLHDRIYGGDLGGRLWRFDLHHGANAAEWATGGVFADFSNPAGRGFVAPPDVSLSMSAQPWFNIALGTAAPGAMATGHRYYVLRDHAPFETWSNEQYQQWRPLREDDLLRLSRPGEAEGQRIGPGYFIELARGEVLSSSITAAGRAVLAVADSTATTASQCQVAVRVGSLLVDSAAAAITALRDAPWLVSLPRPTPAGAAFQYTAEGNGTSPCTLGDQRVAACDVNTAPRRTWWRREDAE